MVINLLLHVTNITASLGMSQHRVVQLVGSDNDY